MHNFWVFAKTDEGMRFWTLKQLRIIQTVSGVLLKLFLSFMAPQITVVFVAFGVAGLKCLQ